MLVEAMDRLGWLDDGAWNALDRCRRADMMNHRALAVGRLDPHAELIRY